MGEVVVFLFRIKVIRVRDFDGGFKNPGHLGTEPLVETGIDIKNRDDKHQDGRDKRERNKGCDQFGLQTAAEDLSLPLDKDLHDIAEDHKEQKQKQDDVKVDEPEEENTVNEWKLLARRKETDFKPSQKTKEERHQKDDKNLPAAFFKLLRAVRLKFVLKWCVV
ncbi:hypothetical protein D3C87_1471890 [compost metagenome]